MAIVSILAVLAFGTVLCIIEIPKMLKDKLYKELCVFVVLLGLGTVIAILRSFNVEIPNPSDLIMWMYSPFADMIKELTT